MELEVPHVNMASFSADGDRVVTVAYDYVYDNGVRFGIGAIRCGMPSMERL